MSFNDEHAIETFKSLISISTEAFKALQLLNGGAVVAVLAYLGQMAPTHPGLVGHAKGPLIFFIAGLVSGTLVYITSYLTQLSLHNENMGNKGYKGGKHDLWLWISFALGIGSVVLFSAGAFACLGALSAVP
jgi:hypothetical protein